MSNQMKAFAIAMVLSGCIVYPAPAQLADIPDSTSARRAQDEVQQLLSDRNNAAPKALTAQTKLREAGALIDSMGFDSARSARDQQLSAASGAEERLAAYDRYARVARRLERKVQTEVQQGIRGVDFLEIARFERLQADVDLAQAEGRLPVSKQEYIVRSSYEHVLSALQSERRKLRAGKSELLVVHRLAKDLRDAELEMSSTESQRIAALARYAALVLELENDAVTALDRVMTQKWHHDAESDLDRAKREMK